MRVSVPVFCVRAVADRSMPVIIICIHCRCRQPHTPTLTQDLVLSCIAYFVDLTFTFAVPAVRARRHAKLQTAVEEALLAIICAVNDKKDHIPPVVSPHLVTFPFDITVAGYACLCNSLAS